MEKAKGLSEYEYNSSQLSHTYDYLATPLLTMLPPLQIRTIAKRFVF